MAASETDSRSSAHDTHQVLGLAVGLGVGIPVALVIVVMWFVTMRHRRMAKEEDERHKAIDLDAEISVAQEKERKHRPVPGSTTYLAKQHAASQRSLNASASHQNLVAPTSMARNEHTLSMVSHDTDQDDLPYTPYIHEKDSESMDNLTRDHLNNLDPPNYLKGGSNGLRNSSSSGSLRDSHSRRNSGSDVRSIDSRGASTYTQSSSPMPDRKKSRGHAAVLQLYDQYQPRFDESRIVEEDEDTKKSPFGDEDNSDAFSFDDHRKTRDFAGDDSAVDENDVTIELDDPRNQHQHQPQQHYHPGPPLPQVPPVPQTTNQESKRTSFVHASPHDDSYGSAHPEDPLVAGRSVSPRYEDALDDSALSVDPEYQSNDYPHESSRIVEQPEYPLDASAHEQFPEVPEHHEKSSYLGVAEHEQDTRPASSVYELPAASGGAAHGAGAYTSRPAGRNPQSSATPHSEWKPVTPQMQDKGFDYHLESTPLSPSSPLHSVPSLSGISRISGNTSNAGSRRGSMSEYMPDVPHFNQGIPGSPGSHNKQRKRNNINSGITGNHMTTPPSQSSMDSSVFLTKQSKFNKKNGGKQNKLPSASQMTY